MLLRCCSQYASKFEKLCSGHSTRKGQFSFHPKERECPKCSNYCTIALISHSGKVMLKIFQTRLQQYLNHEFLDIQSRFRKGRGIRDQIVNICWILDKARVPEKHLLLVYWLCQSLWLCGSQQTVENSERNGNTRPPDLPPRNLYAGHDANATIRTGHGTTD